ncbi:MAG: hypothetical protein AAGF92_12180 [Myxococcota bacterium]
MPGALLVASFVIAGCGDGNGAARSSGDVTVNIVNDDGTSTTTAVDLSGTGLARYVSIFPSDSDDPLAFAEIEVLDTDGNSVATEGTAYFISADDNLNYGEHLNDGDTETGLLLENNVPWVHLDLGSDHEIGSINLHPYEGDDSCCSFSGDDLRVAIASEDYSSPNHDYNIVDDDTVAAPVRKTSIKCDAEDGEDYITDVTFDDDDDDFTCEMDGEVKFDGFSSSTTIYYKCKYDPDDSFDYSDYYYTSYIDQDISSHLTCTKGVFDACMDLLDNGHDECSLWCDDLTTSSHKVKVYEIKCKYSL